MKANQIKVLYVSHWEEGNVESDAILDINTGIITDIKDGEGGDTFEHHIGDVVQIASDSKLGIVGAAVEVDADGDYRVTSILELETFRSAAKFEVLTEEFDGFSNTTTQDDAPLYFQTLEAARKDIQEHLEDVFEAVRNGDMEGSTSPSEFLVRDVKTSEALKVGWSDGNLVFTGSNVVYGLNEDQPATCPQCGSRTDFDELESDLQRHTCLDCGKVFFAETDDGRSDAENGSCKAGTVEAMAKTIGSKLDKLGFRNRGKPIKHTQLLEVASVALGYRNKHVALADTGKPDQAEKTELMPLNRVKLIIEVDYDLNDESIEDMAANLRGMADYAIQNGMLTGATTAEVDDYKVDTITSRSTVPTPDQSKMEYAVIGYYDDNGQIFCHHVEAKNAFNAFAIVAAKANEDGTLPQFIAALPVSDTKRLEYPGEGVVGFETVLDQDDVFPL